MMFDRRILFGFLFAILLRNVLAERHQGFDVLQTEDSPTTAPASEDSSTNKTSAEVSPKQSSSDSWLAQVVSQARKRGDWPNATQDKNKTETVEESELGITDDNVDQLADAAKVLVAESESDDDSKEDRLSEEDQKKLDAILNKPSMNVLRRWLKPNETEEAESANASAKLKRPWASLGMRLAHVQLQRKKLKAAMLLEEKLERAEEKRAAQSTALLLLGTILFVLGLFYLVNSPAKSLAAMTWEMINGMISIFITLATFNCIQLIWRLVKETVIPISLSAEHHAHDHHDDDHHHGNGHSLLQKSLSVLARLARAKVKDDGHHDEPSPGGTALGVVDFLIAFLVFQLIMKQARHQKVSIAAWSFFSGHFLGFVGAQMAANLLSFVPQDLHHLWCGLAALLFVLVSLSMIAHKCRRVVMLSVPPSKDKEEEERAYHRWDHQCEHAENEAYGFILGLMLSISIRFAIVGEVPSLHGNPVGKSREQIQSFTIAICISFFMFLVTIGLSQGLEDKVGPTLRRIFEITKQVCAMNVAWSSVYCAQWLMWYLREPHNASSTITAVAIVALCWSGASFVALVCIHGLSAVLENMNTVSWILEGLMDVKLPFGLILGFSWECVFHKTVKGVCNTFTFEDSPFSADAVTVLVQFGVVLVMAPAWIIYICPKALEMQNEHGHGHAHKDPEHQHGGKEETQRLEESPKTAEAEPAAVALEAKEAETSLADESAKATT
eukprot:TRINITY_DN109916_c0_g1_i1.p1 TRINITY_DN109916_c0_g1~~TRINITY_DN109916_c0_g1_i1.p1  ORF type:complete len:726 (+),score=135.53 TRINITY_DN109916_c0_g1_i1:126-2303(+)